jgi:hypothetical protein
VKKIHWEANLYNIGHFVCTEVKYKSWAELGQFSESLSEPIQFYQFSESSYRTLDSTNKYIQFYQFAGSKPDVYSGSYILRTCSKPGNLYNILKTWKNLYKITFWEPV